MTKQELQDFVSQLPDGEYTPEERQYRMTLFMRIQEAQEQIASGQFFTLEEVEQESERWLTE